MSDYDIGFEEGEEMGRRGAVQRCRKETDRLKARIAKLETALSWIASHPSELESIKTANDIFWAMKDKAKEALSKED